MALAGIKICMDSKDMASKVLMEAMGSNNKDMVNKDGVDSNLSKVMVMQALVVDMVAKANNLLVPVDMELKTRLLDMALLRVVQVVDMALLKVVQVVDMVPLKVMALIMGHKLTTVLMLVVMVMEDNPLKTTIMEVAMDKVLVEKLPLREVEVVVVAVVAITIPTSAEDFKSTFIKEKHFLTKCK